MQVTEEFLALGFHEGVLNKTQLSLLGQGFPVQEKWKNLVLGEVLSTADSNLFLFLRGNFPLNIQKQIVKNYQLVADFHQSKQIPQKTIEKTPITADTLSIYCDGACKGNPGKAGSGLAVYHGQEKPTLYYGEYTPNGTNNTAELHALYQALLMAKESKKAVIYSDSKYSIDCISVWAYGWKKKGWKKKGGEIKNLELIKSAHILYETLKNKVSIKHVKGHAGIEGNELADRMAGYAITTKSVTYKRYSYENVSSVLALSEG